MGVSGTIDWKQEEIRIREIDKYLLNGKDFFDDQPVFSIPKSKGNPYPNFIRDNLQKSLSITTLKPEESAALLNVTDHGLRQDINQTAPEVKKKVYDNKIVFFAPFYCANYCVNNCAYCGFRVRCSPKIGSANFLQVSE